MGSIKLDVSPLSANRAYEIHGQGPKKWIGKTGDYKRFKRDVEEEILRHGIDPIEAPVRVLMEFGLSKQHRSNKQMEGLPFRDLDNCVKPLWDVLEGIVWIDDTQIIQTKCEKVYSDVEYIRLAWKKLDREKLLD